MIFVFDTYALLEIINGNGNYDGYLDAEVVINDFILAELCYKLMREKGHEKASECVNKYADFGLPLDVETIKEAMLFRAMNVKKSLSMTDCISYVMAQRLGIRFLTGDKEFRNMRNVEFVK